MNLTKENFFNEMKDKYPDAMDVFCKWIDEYKKEVGWDKLFNAGAQIERVIDLPQMNSAVTRCKKETTAPKFHELPFEMQNGIMARFELEYFKNAEGKGKETYKQLAVNYRAQIAGIFFDLQRNIEKRQKTLN